MARVARLIDELISIAQVLIHALIAGSRRASSARMTAPGLDLGRPQTSPGASESCQDILTSRGDMVRADFRKPNFSAGDVR